MQPSCIKELLKVWGCQYHEMSTNQQQWNETNLVVCATKGRATEGRAVEMT